MTLDENQRLFLLKDFEEFVADISTDVDQHGRLGPETVELVDLGSRFIAWLRNGTKPGKGVRDYLERRLMAYDEELDYERIAFEHDALAAAIEALR